MGLVKTNDEATVHFEVQVRIFDIFPNLVIDTSSMN